MLRRVHVLPCPAHDEDTRLVEQPHRQGDEAEGEDIGGRGDDGCHDEDDDNGMAAIFAHESGIDETQLGEEPGENRNLEDYAHRQ